MNTMSMAITMTTVTSTITTITGRKRVTAG